MNDYEESTTTAKTQGECGRAPVVARARPEIVESLDSDVDSKREV